MKYVHNGPKNWVCNDGLQTLNKHHIDDVAITGLMSSVCWLSLVFAS